MLVVDSNEASNQPGIVRELEGALPDEVSVAPLESGDFASFDTPLSLGIERKSWPNLVSSMMNHELPDQLTRLLADYDIAILLVEGMPTHANPRGKVKVWGANKLIPFAWVQQTLADYCARGVVLWQVEAKRDTAEAVAAWYRFVSKPAHHTHFKPKRVLPPLRRYGFAQEIMLGFPKVGEVAVEKLAGMSLRDMANWSEEDWQGAIGNAAGSAVYERWRVNG